MFVKRAGEIAFVLHRRTDHCANGILQFAAEVHLPSRRAQMIGSPRRDAFDRGAAGSRQMTKYGFHDVAS